MPLAILERFSLGSTAKGYVEYNDANDRISRFYWQDIPTGCVVTIVIWDTLSPSHPEPVFTGAYTTSGETPIAGNYQAIPDPDDPEGHMKVPDNIIIRFSMLCES